MPALVLLFAGASLILPDARGALLNDGPHGLSEMLYAFTSASNNNGSAFAGLSADQPWLNLTLGLCMFVARFGVIALTLALAGSLAQQRRRPVTAGTMPGAYTAPRRHLGELTVPGTDGGRRRRRRGCCGPPRHRRYGTAGSGPPGW